MSGPELAGWVREGTEAAIPIAQALAVLLAAWLLLRVLRLVVKRLCAHYRLPAQVAVSARRLLGVVVYVSAFMVALGRLGVSASVLWTALTGFTAVAAVAFFAAWSVLSNIFCSVLILTTRPFRVHDHIEVLENGDKPGLRGRVIDINLYGVVNGSRAFGATPPYTRCQSAPTKFSTRASPTSRAGRSLYQSTPGSTPVRVTLSVCPAATAPACPASADST